MWAKRNSGRNRTTKAGNIKKKENYKYLKILKVDIIKQGNEEKKLKKSILDERESFPKPKFSTEISSKR